MSEFQNQEALGLLLGARLGERGFFGAIRESANEGTLFDEIEKGHPRIMDLFLQLLDAARLTIATGEALDFSGFYVVMTTNLGSAESMSLQHSSEATLERHVLTRAQQALRPEVFARISEKLVFHRLSYEHQLDCAKRRVTPISGRDHPMPAAPKVFGFVFGFVSKEQAVSDTLAQSWRIGPSRLATPLKTRWMFRLGEFTTTWRVIKILR